MITATMAAALALDWLFGEPRRWHPLIGFGHDATTIERWLHGDARWRGVVALALLVAPPVLLAAWLRARDPLVAVSIDVLLLYFALGHRSLHDHALPIVAALTGGDTAAAQRLAARIVCRDSEALDPAPAATESVLENGNDGVFGALFWFVLLGGPGALLFRLVSTLDAMWGYRTPRFRRFGWAAARFDDLLNWPSARLTAIAYALLGRTRVALACWRVQARHWESPNAGPVMAAGAGSLGVSIGGLARYHNEWHERPRLGWGPAPVAADINRALRLVRHSVLLWLAAVAALEAIAHA